MIKDPLTRIAFVHTPDAFLAETQQYGAMFMPVWAYTLAAYVEQPERYELKLFDLRFDRVPELTRSDLFVFSGINQDYDSIIRAHNEIRQRFPDSTFII